MTTRRDPSRVDVDLDVHGVRGHQPAFPGQALGLVHDDFAQVFHRGGADRAHCGRGAEEWMSALRPFMGFF